MGCCCSKDDDASLKSAVGRHGSISVEPTGDSKHADPAKYFRVFMATWNVGDAEPASMKPLFEHINDCGGNIDIVVVAAQECGYEPKGTTVSCSDHWYASITSMLPDYALLENKGMWTMRIAVLVKKQIRDHVKDVIVSREATGVGSVGGNKGGVSIGLNVYGTRLLFVGSHLAAHLEKVSERNSDFFEIIEGIDSCFRKDNIEPLNYFHHVFWCGDLNYRIDNLSAEEVIKKSYEGDIAALLPHDQLINAMKKGEVFINFKEAGTPSFTPTYRFLRNTEGPNREFDPWKSRVPSWCDRILTKSLGAAADEIKCLKYDAEHGVRSSDHSPVYAIYEVASRERRLEKIQEKKPVKKHYRLNITRVSGKNLLNADTGSLSDPYIKFRDLDAGASVRTETITDDLNPDWAEKYFYLDLGNIALEELPLHYLHCVIMDADVVKDDPLGQAVFPFDLIVSDGDTEDDVLNKAVELEGPIFHGGKPHGSLKFLATLVEVRHD